MSESFYIDIYDRWKAKLGNDIGASERASDHQHVDDLLPGAEGVGTDNLLYLEQTIAEMWENRLRLLYPQGSIATSLFDAYALRAGFAYDSSAGSELRRALTPKGAATQTKPLRATCCKSEMLPILNGAFMWLAFETNGLLAGRISILQGRP